jgi:hypothetical protein
MAGLITVAELLTRPGFEGLDSGQAGALIEDASALVRLEVQPLLDTVESPDTPPAVVAVLVSMIRRGFTNPTGNAQETLGDYSYMAGTQGGVATIQPTRREQRKLRKAVGRLGAGSLALTSDLPVQPSELAIGLTEDDVL